MKKKWMSSVTVHPAEQTPATNVSLLSPQSSVRNTSSTNPAMSTGGRLLLGFHPQNTLQPSHSHVAPTVTTSGSPRNGNTLPSHNLTSHKLPGQHSSTQASSTSGTPIRNDILDLSSGTSGISAASRQNQRPPYVIDQNGSPASFVSPSDIVAMLTNSTLLGSQHFQLQLMQQQQHGLKTQSPVPTNNASTGANNVTNSTSGHKTQNWPLPTPTTQTSYPHYFLFPHSMGNNGAIGLPPLTSYPTPGVPTHLNTAQFSQSVTPSTTSSGSSQRMGPAPTVVSSLSGSNAVASNKVEHKGGVSAASAILMSQALTTTAGGGGGNGGKMGQIPANLPPWLQYLNAIDRSGGSNQAAMAALSSPWYQKPQDLERQMRPKEQQSRVVTPSSSHREERGQGRDDATIILRDSNDTSEDMVNHHFNLSLMRSATGQQPPQQQVTTASIQHSSYHAPPAAASHVSSKSTASSRSQSISSPSLESGGSRPVTASSGGASAQSPRVPPHRAYHDRETTRCVNLYNNFSPEKSTAGSSQPTPSSAKSHSLHAGTHRQDDTFMKSQSRPNGTTERYPSFKETTDAMVENILKQDRDRELNSVTAFRHHQKQSTMPGSGNTGGCNTGVRRDQTPSISSVSPTGSLGSSRSTNTPNASLPQPAVVNSTGSDSTVVVAAATATPTPSATSNLLPNSHSVGGEIRTNVVSTTSIFHPPAVVPSPSPSDSGSLNGTLSMSGSHMPLKKRIMMRYNELPSSYQFSGDEVHTNNHSSVTNSFSSTASADPPNRKMSTGSKGSPINGPLIKQQHKPRPSSDDLSAIPPTSAVPANSASSNSEINGPTTIGGPPSVSGRSAINTNAVVAPPLSAGRRRKGSTHGNAGTGLKRARGGGSSSIKSSSDDRGSLASEIDLKPPPLKKRRGRGSNKSTSHNSDSRAVADLVKVKKEEGEYQEGNDDGMEVDEVDLEEFANRIQPPPDYTRLSARSLTGPPLDVFKPGGQAFLQLGTCSEIAPKLVKCRACRQAGHHQSNQQQQQQRSIKNSSSPQQSSGNAVFCRFWGFRRLHFNKKGVLNVIGFCNSAEADADDMALWSMHYPVQSNLGVPVARYIIEQIGGKLCLIIKQELDMLKDNSPLTSSATATGHQRRTCGGFPLTNNPSPSHPTTRLNSRVSAGLSSGDDESVPSRSQKDVAWKRPVQGVREMCDVCETTLFNLHWACPKCGYSVCLICFASRRTKVVGSGSSVPGGTAGTATESIESTLKTRSSSNGAAMASGGGSGLNNNSSSGTPTSGNHSRTKVRSYSDEHPWAPCSANRQPHDPARLMLTQILPGCALSVLATRLHQTATKYGIALNCSCPPAPLPAHPTPLAVTRPQLVVDPPSAPDDLHLLADLALKEGGNGGAAGGGGAGEVSAGSVTRPPPVLSPPHRPASPAAPTPSWPLAPATPPHSYHSLGEQHRLLRLHRARADGNLQRFQREWRGGHPVVVSGCQEHFDRSIWHPKAFSREFGQTTSVLVNCETGVEFSKHPMKTFWDGFECMKKRIAGKDGRPVCLKLKDWPPTEDFSEVLPDRHRDLMANLPLSEYTHRSGELNLAARLPEFFVRPDLGPKLYNAYGVARQAKTGTTNLHLDIADAVNVMLYVGVPEDCSSAERDAVLEAMRDARVDQESLNRTTGAGGNAAEVPGALWHIFLASDSERLREFLSKVARERGERLDADSDPIHDQLFYLDHVLIDRLKEESGVEPYSIVQFQGDAIFIPAGAAHQVRNLNSCIKAAEDFVSPENLSQCLKLTQEFRRLSPTHFNHEDKLQAKNVIYHAVKDALAVILCSSQSSQKLTCD